MSQNQPSAPVWGLRSDITPSFGARLVQEGCRLHFLPDRASFCGNFTAEQLQTLDATFPQFVKQLESALKSGALDPRQSRRYSTILNGLTCEANTNGSHGYVYLVIYPAE
ncbi:type IV toxin-antitoxin system YeeU family antitoxin [Salmonella enterica subsp. enterica]|nr:type IV toxin-antitoxin system YeeU family antitoxin [Salmonella enterica subsp. enterica]